MSDFRGRRVTHAFTQVNLAPPETVFPLLCPVAEARWVPGWQYRLIYSHSGVAEPGCVFTTPNEDGAESTWVVTARDPAQFRISFVWVHPGLVAAQIEIELRSLPGSKTEAKIRYTYTGLSEKGNSEVARYDEPWFRQKMEGWQSAINHYLTTPRITTGE